MTDELKDTDIKDMVPHDRDDNTTQMTLTIDS